MSVPLLNKRFSQILATNLYITYQLSLYIIILTNVLPNIFGPAVEEFVYQIFRILSIIQMYHYYS